MTSDNKVSRKDIEEIVKELTSGQLQDKDKKKDIPSDVEFSVLGMDSLGAVELIMGLEERWGIEIPDSEADKVKTVGCAVDLVARKLSEKGRLQEEQ